MQVTRQAQAHRPALMYSMAKRSPQVRIRFRTFKETVFHWVWVFKSIEQIDRFSADFVQFYNRDRPHSSWGGRTPDEVYFNRSKQYGATSRVRYFDGHLCWYKFG